MKTQNLVNAFEVNETYQMSFIGDSDLKPGFVCIKRTEKTATFRRANGTETLTRRIKVYDGNEYVLEGSYSMAPSINAKRKVK